MSVNWNNLTKGERREYMSLQTAPHRGYGGGGYLPDDCSECRACGTPIVGTGFCESCYKRWKMLDNKLREQEVKDEP